MQRCKLAEWIQKLRHSIAAAAPTVLQRALSCHERADTMLARASRLDIDSNDTGDESGEDGETLVDVARPSDSVKRQRNY